MICMSLVHDLPTRFPQVTVRLGNEANGLLFEPSTVELTAGRLTKLKLVNPSQNTHYFTALEFAVGAEVHTWIIVARPLIAMEVCHQWHTCLNAQDKSYTVLALIGEPEVEVKGKIQVMRSS